LKFDASEPADHALESDLIPDLLPKLDVQLSRHTRREQASSQAAGLKNHDLAAFEQSVSKQHLRNLSRFARAGWRLQHKSRSPFERLNDFVFFFVNRQQVGHGV